MLEQPEHEIPADGAAVTDLAKRFPAREGNFQLFSHPDCLLHDTGAWHPETAARLNAILAGCAALPGGTPVSYQVPEPARISQLVLVHQREYLLRLKAECEGGSGSFMSPDNHISGQTFRAVLAAGGCALALAETMADGGAGFALIRPPGHHAGRHSAEGFCFVNHLALAVEAIKAREPEATFLVVDFDVHHGNGVDGIYSEDPRVFYYSLHGTPDHVYPHSGYAHETGRGAGTGHTRNIALPLGCSGDDWLRQFEADLSDCEGKLSPDYLLVGAGFDAHREDPFALMKVEDRHFIEAARRLKQIADRRCRGRLGFFLEGGYSVAVLERLVPQIIAALADGRAKAG